jgi:hypothetical protein
VLGIPPGVSGTVGVEDLDVDLVVVECVADLRLPPWSPEAECRIALVTTSLTSSCAVSCAAGQAANAAATNRRAAPMCSGRPGNRRARAL